MKNNSISDFVAATMDAVLKSESHKSLFNTQYKFASDENDAKKCPKCGGDDCSCGDAMSADDNDAKKKKMPPWLKNKEESSDSSSADDNYDKDPITGAEVGANVPGKAQPIVFPDQVSSKSAPTPPMKPAPTTPAPAPQVSKADDLFADDSSSDESSSDSSDADDEMQAVAFDMAIDSLLTASAALDSVGLEKSAALSLRLASFVVEAKKQDSSSKKKDSKKGDSKKNPSSSSKKTDSNSVDDKAKAKAKKEKELAAEKKKKEKEKADKEKAAAKAKADKEKASKK